MISLRENAVLRMIIFVHLDQKKPELFLRILMTSIGLLILMIWMLAKSLLQQCLPRNQRLHRYGFVVSENIRKLFGSKTIFSLIKEMMKHIRINFWHIL